MVQKVNSRLPEPTMVTDQRTREYLNELIRSLSSKIEELNTQIEATTSSS